MLSVTQGQSLLRYGGEWCGIVNDTQETCMSKGNRVYYSQVPERKLQHALQGHRKNIRFWSGSRSKSDDRAQTTAFTGVSVGEARQGRANSFRLASLNNSGWLWAIRMAPSSLVPDPGMIKTEEYCLLGSMGQREGLGF